MGRRDLNPDLLRQMETVRSRFLRRVHADGGGIIMQRDGGPGSGNWGHAGRPGQRGGSAPGSGGGIGSGILNAGGSGSSTVSRRYNLEEYSGTPKEQMTKALTALGHSKEDIEKVRQLFRAHSYGNDEAQAEANAEIAEHIRKQDSIGKLLRDKVNIEEVTWRERRKAEQKWDEERYSDQKAWALEQMKPGGVYQSLGEDDLDWILGPDPKTKYAREPRWVRVGTMDRDILPFSTNPDGAGSFRIENAEPGNVHEFSLSEMREKGYRPIGGLATGDVGQADDSEVLFARFPK